MSGLVFSLVLTVLSSFSMRYTGISMEVAEKVSAGLLWLVFIFASSSILNQVSLIEREQDSFFGLMLSPVKRESIFLGKFIFCFCYLLLLFTFTLMLLALFFGLGIGSSLFNLLVIGVLGVAGFSSSGLLLGMISSMASAREILFPILLIPVTLPLWIGCVSLTQGAFAGDALALTDFWLICVCAFNVIAFTAAISLFEHTVWE